MFKRYDLPSKVAGCRDGCLLSSGVKIRVALQIT